MTRGQALLLAALEKFAAHVVKRLDKLEARVAELEKRTESMVKV